MGSCISKKRSSSSNSRGVITCPPSFVYIPGNQINQLPDTRRISGDNPVPSWSGNVPFKRRAASRKLRISCSPDLLRGLSRKPSVAVDFRKIYRKSDIVDKKLFLNCAFAVHADEMYSPTPSPSLLTPITPAADFNRIIDGTFSPGTVDSGQRFPAMYSPSLEPSGSTSYRPSLHYNLPSPTTISPHFTSGYQSASGTLNSRGTVATTFISENCTKDVFSFDEDSISEAQNRFYSSSLKKEVLALF